MGANEKSGLDFEGNVAIVTGAARGIGQSTALAFSRKGATVVLVDILGQELKDVREMIRKEGREALDIEADVADNGRVQDVVLKVEGRYGRIDILVNNAGIDPGSAPLIRVSEDAWKKALDINLSSVFFFCKRVLPVMLKQGKGSIVNVASIAGKEPNIHMAPYAVSKAGLIALTKVLAKEVAREGIRVNAVAPGLTKTDLLNHLSPEQFNHLLEKIPMGRVGYPEEIADLICFLASEKASFITGQCVNIAGGRGEY